MSKIGFIAVVVSALVAGWACTELAEVPEFPKDEAMAVIVPAEAIGGELIVKFAPEMSDILDRAVATRASEGGLQAGSRPTLTRSGMPSTDEVLDILGAYSLERIFPVDSRNEERTREAGLHLWYLVHFDEGTDVAEAMERLGRLGEVSKVQCNRPVQRSYDRNSRPIVVSEAAVRALTAASAQQSVAEVSAQSGAGFSTGTSAQQGFGASGNGIPASASGEFQFDDPLLPFQWGYINRGSYGFTGGEYNPYAQVVAGCDVGCEGAWELCAGDPSIIVAILDDGVMYDHPDLAANMWVNEGEEFYAGLDTDGNGYKDDKYGYNFVTDCGVITYSDINDIGHGTHIAGTIAAVNNNGLGVSGIAGGDGTPDSGVKIMSLQLFAGNYLATLAAEARAMKYAADNGAVIIQCSWGYNSALSNSAMGYTPGPATEEEWASYYPLEKEALDYFIENAGSPNGTIDGGLAFFAAGNEYSGLSAFPAAYSKCISVAALAADFTPSSFTNFGSEVRFAAPGGDSEYYCIPGKATDEYDTAIAQGMILSTLTGENEIGPIYGYYEGTSMACPHAAGVAALGLSYAARQRRHFTAEEFLDLMSATASDLDRYYGADDEKVFYYNPAALGQTPSRMELVQYRGRMGRLPNAAALLRAIPGSGADMKVPNVYVAPDAEVQVELSRYFLGGETLTYSCSVADGSVASVSVNGTCATVRGISTGSTQATLRVSNGASQDFTITVRSGSASNGWL